jgi:hypothetical protein
MLLLGLISIVGLSLLTYSFEFSLVFLTVLFASLLTGAPLRKFLLGLKHGRQKSGVVTTFWGSMTLFLVSLFSMIVFIYLYLSLGEEFSRITALETLFSIILLTMIISSIVGLFILIFLRSKTRFPRWIVVLATFSWLVVLTVVFSFFRYGGLFVWTLSLTEHMVKSEELPPDAFNVSYHAKVIFRGKALEVEEEYELNNHRLKPEG